MYQLSTVVEIILASNSAAIPMCARRGQFQNFLVIRIAFSTSHAFLPIRLCFTTFSIDLSCRNTTQACLTWEDIIIENPTDMFALKMAHNSYFDLGYQSQMRDSIARVLPLWKKNMPLYG